MTVQRRTDSHEIESGKIETLPSGAIRIPGTLTRCGVFPYRQPDGSVVRELRHPREVFDRESLQTLRSAPVTDLHPAEFVTPQNFGRLAKGHVEVPSVDGIFVNGPVVVADQALIAKVKDRSACETSSGYSCDIVREPGIYEGQEFDQQQTKIRYNHVALGPKNWARGGVEMTLRLDGKTEDTMTKFAELDRKNRTIRLDGVLYKIPEDRDKLMSAARRMDGVRLDQLDPEALREKLMELQGLMATAGEMIASLMADMIETDIAAEEAVEAAATNAEEQLASEFSDRMDAAGQIARLRLDGRVKLTHTEGENKGKHKDGHQLRLDTLTALGREVPEGLRGDRGYVRGVVSALLPSSADLRADAGGRVNGPPDEVAGELGRDPNIPANNTPNPFDRRRNMGRQQA